MIRHLRRPALWFADDRFAWQRRLAAYLLLTSAFALCLGLIQHNYGQDSARARAQVVQDCIQRAQGRQVLRDLVTASYSGSSIDYSKIPSYAELDPATQRFLRDLAAPGAGLAARRDQVLASVPPIACPGK